MFLALTLAGNVGSLINKVDPVNKGEVCLDCNSAQDLVIIGTL